MYLYSSADFHPENSNQLKLTSSAAHKLVVIGTLSKAMNMQRNVSGSSPGDNIIRNNYIQMITSVLDETHFMDSTSSWYLTSVKTVFLSIDI